MSTTDDDEMQRSLEELRSTESPTLGQLVRAAPFPIYGLIETPGDLTLHGIGYCIADPEWYPPDAVEHPTLPQIFCQAVLDYGYPRERQDARMRLEIVTTATTHSPISAPAIEDLLSTSTTRYQVDDEIPPLGSEAASFIIERYAIIGGRVLAVIEYTPDAPPRERGVLLGTQAHHVEDDGSPLAQAAMRAAPPPVSPEWSFTLRSPDMWVEVRAYGWNQQEIVQLLHQLATISDKPDVVAHYNREMFAWQGRTHSPEQ